MSSPPTNPQSIFQHFEVYQRVGIIALDTLKWTRLGVGQETKEYSSPRKIILIGYPNPDGEP